MRGSRSKRENLIEVLRLRLAPAERARNKQLPEAAARSGSQRGGLQFRAPVLRRLRPKLDRLRQQSFEAAAQSEREDGLRALGRNGDNERRAIEDGAELKIAEIRLIDHVH